eukprot:4885283-Prymnesium_polylepis.1
MLLFSQNDIVLMILVGIRLGHDDIYRREFTQEERQCLESIRIPDRFVLHGTHFNAAMRCRSPGGDIVRATAVGTPPVSLTNAKFCSLFIPELLLALDEVIDEVAGASNDAALGALLQKFPTGGRDEWAA